MKPRKGSHYYLKFHDHSSEASMDIANTEPLAIILELIGEIVGENDQFYKVLVVKASSNGNNECWNIIKSTIIEIKEVKLNN